MALTLLQTLYWGSNPTHTLDDFAGVNSIARQITAAESHDGSNATYAQLSCQGDLVEPALATLKITKTLQTLTSNSTIAKVIMYFTGKSSGSYADNTVYFQFGGSDVGNPMNPDSGFIEYSQEFSINPNTGLAWTKTAINSAAWGMGLSGVTVDENSVMSTSLSEFRVEVYGSTSSSSLAARAIGIEVGNRWWTA